MTEQRNTTTTMSRLFTPCQNEQVVALVTRAFDADGMLVSKGKRNNQKEARANKLEEE